MLKCLANIILRMGGWKILGEIPSIPQAVFLAAPHTSNWDGFWLLVYKVAIDLDVRFLAKDTLFWWPLSSILRALGAMSLDRDDASGSVLQLVGTFEQQDSLFLALAPEGTRASTTINGRSASDQHSRQGEGSSRISTKYAPITSTFGVGTPKSRGQSPL